MFVFEILSGFVTVGKALLLLRSQRRMEIEIKNRDTSHELEFEATSYQCIHFDPVPPTIGCGKTEFMKFGSEGIIIYKISDQELHIGWRIPYRGKITCFVHIADANDKEKHIYGNSDNDNKYWVKYCLKKYGTTDSSKYWDFGNFQVYTSRSDRKDEPRLLVQVNFSNSNNARTTVGHKDADNPINNDEANMVTMSAT